MDFLGIGLPELAVILLLTLIVVGPKRLPETAAQIARTIREVRKYSSSMTREFSTVMKDLEREYEEIKGELKETGDEARKSTAAVTGEITGAAEDAQQQLREATSDETKPDQPANVVSMKDAVAQRDPQSEEKS